MNTNAKARRYTKSLLLAATCLLPLAAMAQENQEFLLEEVAPPKEPAPIFTSSIEVGALWVSDSSFKFGEFSGLQDNGLAIIGNIHLQIRDPYDSGEGEYFIIDGTNLGLTSRFLGVEYGKQGQFGLFASYDQIPKFLHDDARTPYIISNDGTNLTLPAGWVPGNRDISQMTALNTSLQDIDLSHDRQKFGGGFKWIPSKYWTVTSTYYRELKNGNRTIAAIFGTSGGNPAGTIVPEPIDYETDNFDFSVGYADKKMQFGLSYNLSQFRDNNTALTFQNPYIGTGRWPAAVFFPDGFGRLGLPPDNKAHHINLSGNYLVNQKTRISATFSYGHMTQDDAFLPFTVNPNLAAPIGLPRSSLNGEIDTLLANLRITSQVTPKFNLSARYRYEDRDNKTPRDIFVMVSGDAEDQDSAVSSSARLNLPYSRKQHLFEAGAAYRIAGSTKVSVDYSFEQLERNFSEVAKTREHRIKGKLQGSPSATTSAWASAEYASRNGTDYDDNALFIASHTPAFLGPDPDEEFENHPLMRKFFIADRDRFRLYGTFNWLATDKAALSLIGRYQNDDYDQTVIGLTGSTQSSYTFDASFQATDAIGYHAYYTYEAMSYDQTGLSSRSNTSPADLLNLDLLGWTTETEDTIHTIGAGLDWAAIENKLDITFDYYFSKADTSFEQTAGTNLSFTPLPDLKSTLHNIDLRADYRYSPQLLLRARYQFQDYKVMDFALDGVNPDTMSFIIGLGNQSPNYSIHVIGVSTIYQF